MYCPYKPNRQESWRCHPAKIPDIWSFFSDVEQRERNKGQRHATVRKIADTDCVQTKEPCPNDEHQYAHLCLVYLQALQ